MTAQRPATPRELPGRYFRRAAAPAVAVTAVTAAAGAGLDGATAAWGAALGGLVVLVFFGVDLLAMRLSAGWEPTLTFLLVMGEYLAKILGLAVLFAVLRGGDQTVVDPWWVGVGLAVAGVAFLTGLVVAYLRIPTFVVDPDST